MQVDADRLGAVVERRAEAALAAVAVHVNVQTEEVLLASEDKVADAGVVGEGQGVRGAKEGVGARTRVHVTDGNLLSLHPADEPGQLAPDLEEGVAVLLVGVYNKRPTGALGAVHHHGVEKKVRVGDVTQLATGGAEVELGLVVGAVKNGLDNVREDRVRNLALGVGRHAGWCRLEVGEEES